MTAMFAPPGTVYRRHNRATATFPSVSLPMREGMLPVEVNLIARFGHGAGTKMFFDLQARQQRHPRFVDALEEPSAKLGATDFARGDATALYSFAVSRFGHPFHRHAGHRVFTAISGSSGAQLRFSSATPAALAADPENFFRELHYVNVPPDCLFTVRFCGETWHQFAPLKVGSRHPALFALSIHTNELGGELSEALCDQIRADRADIPTLTQVLPEQVQRLLLQGKTMGRPIPTTALSLQDRPGGLREVICGYVRSVSGHLRRLHQWLDRRSDFVSTLTSSHVVERASVLKESLLRGELNHLMIHHEDCFTLTLAPDVYPARTASAWLAALLAGFLQNRPAGVSRLMRLRNVLVKPLKLRSSPLGCPVSSLLTPHAAVMFDHRFPVRSYEVSQDQRHAQVILGADDRHLVFRCCVGVRLLEHGAVEMSIATRVSCSNLFGRLYMALIDTTHRKYVAPTMLAYAAEAALRSA